MMRQMPRTRLPNPVSGLRAAALALAISGVCGAFGCESMRAAASDRDRAGETEGPRVVEGRPPPRDDGAPEARAGTDRAKGEPAAPAVADEMHGPAALDGLPPLELSLRARAHMELARRLNRKGLDAHRAADFRIASDRFFEAVEVDPGNVYARYNLACSLARLGDREAAVALLKQFRDSGCGSCLGRILRAREDGDFEALHEWAPFVAATEVADDALSEPSDSVAEVVTWIDAVAKASRAGKKIGKKLPPPRVIDPLRKITVKIDCPFCTGQPLRPGMVRGAGALHTWLDRRQKEVDGDIESPGRPECNKSGCCTFAEADRAPGRDALVPQEVCFRLQSSVATSVSKVTFMRFAPPPPLVPVVE